MFVRYETRGRVGRLGAVLALCASVAGLGSAGALAAPGKAGPSAGRGDIVDAGGPNAIAGSYIVVFKDSAVKTNGVHALTNAKAAKANAKVKHTYESALDGFAGTMSESAARKLTTDPDVEYVAQNHTVEAVGDQANPPSWGAGSRGPA
jgi:hypothetical protein